MHGDVDRDARARDRADAELPALSRTGTPDRDVVADRIGDLLRARALSAADAERVVRRLAACSVTETSYALRESALNAIAEAAVAYTLPYELLAPLAKRAHAVEQPDLLGHILFSLAATHDERARETAELFLGHPAPDVRREAAEAVRELDAVRAGLRRDRDRSGGSRGPGTNVSGPSFRGS